MSMRAPRAIVGVFDERAGAERAIEALNAAGFRGDQIHYSGDTSSGGFLASIKRLFTGEDSSSSGLMNDLRDFGLTDDEAHYYADQHAQGRAVVAVRPDNRADEVTTILRQNGAHDFSTRPGTTMASRTEMGVGDTSTQRDRVGTSDTGYVETDAEAFRNRQQPLNPDRPVDAPITANVANTAYADTDDRMLKLREEQLNAEKQRVQAGEVTLRKDVVTEQKNIEVPVEHEEVIVHRRDVTPGQVDNTPITDGDSIRVPVTEEQVRVTKNTVDTGEVSIGKRTVQDTEQVTDTVRREEARVERSGDAEVRDDTNNLRNDIRDRDQRQP